MDVFIRLEHVEAQVSFAHLVFLYVLAKLIFYQKSRNYRESPIGSMGRLYIYLHEWLMLMINEGFFPSVFLKFFCVYQTHMIDVIDP